uniref:Zn(2)-C6 fungal-type domain-containing protein n=1 Tax=Moniliophthora roreri TaxID=221103 RepID=A0A0W0FK72_MONRR
MSTTGAATEFHFKGVIRFQVKSRSGCLTCRKRRIKCDEAKPICRNCHRKNLECVQRPEKKSNQEQQQETVLYKPLTTPTPIPISITSFRMIHHFSIATSASFCSDPESTTTVSTTIPQLSWCNPPLLHAMLSFTALHLGRLYSEEPKWVYLASAHRKAAIDALPSAISLDAKFLIIGFFTMYTISSSLASSPENIFSLISSLHNVWSALEGHPVFTNQRLKPLDPFLMNWQVDSAIRALGHLRRIYDPTMSGLESESEDLSDPAIKAAYRESVEALYVAYPLTRTGFESNGAVLWPALFGKRFRDLLNEKKQRALMVLYYYLGMLKDVSESCWWASDIARCQEYVYGLLDVGWRGWLLDVVDSDVTENAIAPTAGFTRRLTY